MITTTMIIITAGYSKTTIAMIDSYNNAEGEDDGENNNNKK